MEKTYLTTNKIGKWDCNSFSLELESDHSCCGLTWPPKYYSCIFCKRAFRSAQALGGHMNVHRKDRARLKLLSSLVLRCQNLKPNSNPNPNFSPSNLLSTRSVNFSLSPHHSWLSPLLNNPSSSLLPYGENGGDLSKEKTMTPFLGAQKLKTHAQKYELEVRGVTDLDLERRFKESNGILDLELRLG